MKVLNETPAIFDLSVRYQPPDTRPLQEPGADQRSKFDFPAFDVPSDGLATTSVRICDPDDSSEGTLYIPGAWIVWDE